MGTPIFLLWDNRYIPHCIPLGRYYSFCSWVRFYEADLTFYFEYYQIALTLRFQLHNTPKMKKSIKKC